MQRVSVSDVKIHAENYSRYSLSRKSRFRGMYLVESGDGVLFVHHRGV